ncbi:MAG: hypothetical protein CMJ77_01190 [Planctomycetaceae bacterium]|nr:hypothetical protein [Planctomycetaceae bacterium]
MGNGWSSISGQSSPSGGVNFGRFRQRPGRRLLKEGCGFPKKLRAAWSDLAQKTVNRVDLPG